MRIFVLGAFSFFLLFNTTFAASAALVLYEEYKLDETCDEEIEVCDYGTTELYRLEDGGSYEIEFGIETSVRVESSAPVFDAEGYLYLLSEDGTSRELVEHIGGFSGGGVRTLAFTEAGVYELDIYELPPPILLQRNWWETLLAEYFMVPRAYAQSPDYFIETIRFTVTEAGAVEECCSSVMFLPGIKGSILKEDQLIGSDTLWPPTIWSNDVSELALTEDGESVSDVFVDGIIETFHSVPVYDGFVSFMDSLVADGTITTWQSFAYDWRLSLETVLEDGVTTAGGTVDLVSEIETLAENSDTGQVTVVAHSMGGLLGKALIKKLEADGKADLIDAFVMVGSPQLGTPQAITSLLHGDGEGIPSDVPYVSALIDNSIVDPATARTVAHNMPSSHSLLPSPLYFDTIADPVVVFDEETELTGAWRNAWGSEIASHGGLVSFLTNEGSVRSTPSADNLKQPSVLRDDLLSDVTSFHGGIDAYTFPEHIRVVQIAGWGLPTVKGVKYTEEHGEQDYQPLFTTEGDGTVVHASAIVGNEESYYFDLALHNTDREHKEHKDLAGINQLNTVLRAIIEEVEVSTNELVLTIKPDPAEVVDKLLISAHSPVILGAYDGDGNFTGIDAAAERVVEEIPGSSFLIFGQSQYVFLPKEGEYEFVYQGTGEGETTVRIGEFVGDEVTPIVSYSDIETTENTEASFTVDSENASTTEIHIDTDGDGTDDKTVQDDSQVSELTPLQELIILLKEKVQSVDNGWLRYYFELAIQRLERRAEKFSHPWWQNYLNKEGERVLGQINAELDKQKQDNKKSWWRWW